MTTRLVATPGLPRMWGKRWVVGEYFQPYKLTDLKTIPNTVDVCYFGFAWGNNGQNMTLDKPASLTTLAADITASKATGIKWSLSVGGGGPTLTNGTLVRTTAEGNAVANGLKPLIDANGFQGVDWDLENYDKNGWTLEGVRAASANLKAQYGSDFFISMTPRPYEFDVLGHCGTLYSEGLLDYVQLQAYDNAVYANDAQLWYYTRLRLNQCEQQGIPIERIMLGARTDTANNPGAGANTVANHTVNLEKALRTRPIMGAFLWEAGVDSAASWGFANGVRLVG